MTASVVMASVKPAGANDLRFSGSHGGRRDHAACASKVIGVTVGVDYSHDRLARAMREIEVESSARGARCKKSVYDDETGLALHDRHIRLRKTANLTNAESDLKQAAYDIELRLAPKTRIYGWQRFVFKKCPASYFAARISGLSI